MPIRPFASGRPAPVAVFAYKRSVHLSRTLDSLAANPEAQLTDVVIYCDAAGKPADGPGVAEVWSVVEKARGFHSVTAVRRDTNYGLARSIIEGVSSMLAQEGQVIVVEDDLLLSKHFLRYMNDGLQRYRSDERVASVHGYSYPTPEALPETFFLRGADCWGWATWSRAWEEFDPDGRRLLSRLRERRLVKRFDLDGSYPYTRMLEQQIEGINDSWAIRWHASCFLAGRLTLYPGRSLVENIGNDSTGTHCGTTSAYSRAPTPFPVSVGTIEVEESRAAREAFARFHAGQRRPFDRARRLLARALPWGR
ncbi:MAG: glycosyltransferase family 2 protein [Caldimonas sp.]